LPPRSQERARRCTNRSAGLSRSRTRAVSRSSAHSSARTTLRRFDDEGNVTGLHLHQSLVGSLSANDTTLRVNTQEQIFVDFTAETVREVGVLDSIFGPNGPIFFRTGFALSDLPTGATIARHGVLDIFDPAEFCAALS